MANAQRLPLIWLSEAQPRAYPSTGVRAGGGWGWSLNSAPEGAVSTLELPADERVPYARSLRHVAMRRLRCSLGGGHASPLVRGRATARKSSRFKLTHHRQPTTVVNP